MIFLWKSKTVLSSNPHSSCRSEFFSPGVVPVSRGTAHLWWQLTFVLVQQLMAHRSSPLSAGRIFAECLLGIFGSISHLAQEVTSTLKCSFRVSIVERLNSPQKTCFLVLWRSPSLWHFFQSKHSSRLEGLRGNNTQTDPQILTGMGAWKEGTSWSIEKSSLSQWPLGWGFSM